MCTLDDINNILKKRIVNHGYIQNAFKLPNYDDLHLHSAMVGKIGLADHMMIVSINSTAIQ